MVVSCFVGEEDQRGLHAGGVIQRSCTNRPLLAMFRFTPEQAGSAVGAKRVANVWIIVRMEPRQSARLVQVETISIDLGGSDVVAGDSSAALTMAVDDVAKRACDGVVDLAAVAATVVCGGVGHCASHGSSVPKYFSMSASGSLRTGRSSASSLAATMPLMKPAR